MWRQQAFFTTWGKNTVSTTRLERRKYMQLMMRNPNAAPAELHGYSALVIVKVLRSYIILLLTFYRENTN